MEKHRYAFLDGIRGMAAIFVLTRHTSTFWQFGFYRNYLAVDVFFILSGFVIASAYDQKIVNGIINFKKFAVIRLIRLYPVFLLSVFVGSVLLFLSFEMGVKTKFQNGNEMLSVVICSLFFIPSHIAGSIALFPLNGPYWSLFFELITNFLYAGIRGVLNKYLIGLIILLSWLVVVYSSILNSGLDDGYRWGWVSIAVGLARSIFGIFVGFVLYKFSLSNNYLLAKVKKYSFLSWVAFFVIAVILILPSSRRFNWIIDVISVSLVFPVSILIASYGKSVRFEKVLLFLGTVSYPIYVLHKPLGELISLILGGIEANYAPISGFILLLLLLPLSYMVEKLYDIPIRRWLTMYSKRSRN